MAEKIKNAWSYGGWRTDILPRYLMQVVLGVAIAWQIIDYHNLFDDYFVQLAIIDSVAVMLLLLLYLFAQKESYRNAAVLVIASTVWSITYVLMLPPDTPFILVNYLVVVMVIWQMTDRYVVASTVGFVIIMQLNILLNDSAIRHDFWRALINSIFLTLLAVIGTIAYRQQKRQQAINAERANKANIERERLQSLINSMADAVIATDQQGVVILYNGAALDLLNINVSLEKQQLREYLKLYDNERHQVDIFSKLEEESSAYFISRELSIKADEEDYTNLYASIAPVQIGYGHSGQRGFILLLRDITREKSLEEERNEFISVVSHELRTPITIAEGNLSNAQLIVAKNPNVDEGIVASLNDAHEQVVFLAEMINDLSTLSRAERKVLNIELETIEPKQIVDGVVTNYTTEAQEKGLIIKGEYDDELPKIITSRLYLNEILQNFVTNAIKYTQEGSITVSARKSENGVEFAVQDSGIGISKADKKKLFEKFFRSEDFRTRESGGTGLGLYITLKLAARINSKIDVQSKLNQGSTFTLIVPSIGARSDDQAQIAKEETKQFLEEL